MKTLTPFLVLCLFLISEVVFAQAPIVAIVGFRASNTEAFSFVAAQDIANGTVIYFIDEEYYLACDGYRSDGTCAFIDEGLFTYTSTGLSKGEVVVIEEVSTGTPGIVSGGGTLTGNGNFNFGSTEPLSAFSASNSGSPQTSVTQVHCTMLSTATAFDGGPNTGEDPTGDHTNAIIIFPGGSDVEFDPAKRSMEVDLNAIKDPANWVAAGANLSPTNFSMLNLLPVELTYFVGHLNGKQCELKWSTATETNNEKFVVEYSLDGRSFVKIGEVSGQGTTEYEQAYSFMHQKLQYGDNYYRLKQMDFDGAFEYSDIVHVKLNDRNNTAATVSPNPFTDNINISFVDEQANRVYQIYDINGRLVLRGVLSAENNSQNLNVSQLPAGSYLIQLITGETVSNHRIIKS